jgi:pantetheine-phosphate adenylyltransferase
LDRDLGTNLDTDLERIKMTRALYPGTFDPIHNGHIDIAARASALFSEVVFAVYDAPPKKLLFSTEERLELAQEALAHLPNVTVVSYTGLTVNVARDLEIDVIVRGLRNVADFEFERQIGWANHDLAPEIDLCCLYCTGDYASLSATILKEVASLGGDFHQWTPPHVQIALESKFPRAEALSPSRVNSRSAGKLAHRGQ